MRQENPTFFFFLAKSGSGAAEYKGRKTSELDFKQRRRQRKDGRRQNLTTRTSRSGTQRAIPLSKMVTVEEGDNPGS